MTKYCFITNTPQITARNTELNQKKVESMLVKNNQDSGWNFFFMFSLDRVQSANLKPQYSANRLRLDHIVLKF